MANKLLENLEKIKGISNPYSNARDMNLVNMILNLESNNSNDFKKPADVYNTYLDMPEFKFSEKFKESLKESRKNLYTGFLMKGSLKALKPNDPESFLVIALLGKGHLWSTIIKKTDEGYNAIIINKGMRYWHDPLEEFVFKATNVDKLVESLNTASMLKMTNIEDVYRKFIDNSDAKYNLNLKAGPQKVGNCFTKNIQAGVKIAYATKNMTPSQMRNFRINKEYTSFGTGNDNKTTLKWEGFSTEEVQKSFVTKLAERNPSIKTQVFESLDTYKSNKHLMESFKKNDVSVKAFLEAFDTGFSGIKTMRNENKIKLLMKKLTPFTFKGFNPQIETLVKETKNPEYIARFHELNEYSKTGKTMSMATYMQFFMEAKHDFAKTLERLFDREGRYNNLPQNERTKILLNEVTIHSLNNYSNKVKEVLKNLYGQENIEAEYSKLVVNATEKMKQINESLPEMKNRLSIIAEDFPLIANIIKKEVGGFFLEQVNYYLMENVNPKKALALANRAITIDDTAESFFKRGLCYSKLNQTDNAIVDFTKSINMNPSNYTAYCCRGQLQLQNGNKIAGLKDFKRALELNPDPAMITTLKEYNKSFAKKIEKIVVMPKKHEIAMNY